MMISSLLPWFLGWMVCKIELYIEIYVFVWVLQHSKNRTALAIFLESCADIVTEFRGVILSRTWYQHFADVQTVKSKNDNEECSRTYKKHWRDITKLDIICDLPCCVWSTRYAVKHCNSHKDLKISASSFLLSPKDSLNHFFPI